MIISRAPLRISFFGGGSDFPEYFREHGGRVLSTAMDRYNYMTATPFPSRLFDYKIRLSYSRGELVHTTGEIQHPVFRACLELLGLREDIELHAVADLPAFTGLGSSSSFTVTLLYALHAFKGEDVGPAVLAREAIRVEREILGECVGCQDQVAAAYGGFNLVEFSADADPVVRPLKIPVENLQKLQKGMLLVFTHLKRRAQEIEKSKLPKFAARSPELEEMKAAATVFAIRAAMSASLARADTSSNCVPVGLFTAIAASRSAMENGSAPSAIACSSTGRSVTRRENVFAMRSAVQVPRT